MGGDDLSDEEYLDYAPPSGTATDDGDSIYSDVEDDELPSSKKPAAALTSATLKKRLQEEDSAAQDEPTNGRKKHKVPTSPQDVLLHAGRGIAMDGIEAQSKFLGALYSHTIKLTAEEEEVVGESSITSGEDHSFSFHPHLYAPPDGIDLQTKQYRHTNLAVFLKSGPLPSNKRLKNWKHPQSPMVIVVTLSAIRAVELLKQLSSLRLPVAKLFAKHMSVEDQAALLSKGFGKGKKSLLGNVGGGVGRGDGGKKGSKSGGYYSLGVGTPGRLLKLLRYHRNEDDGTSAAETGVGMMEGGALRLNHTEIILIDCHEDSKGWNVCTLNDTSRELMEFMRAGVITQLEKRKGKIKLVMF